MGTENNKTKWLHVRLSEDEYGTVQKHFKNTTCRKLSEYIRNKLLEKKLTTYYRNKSLDDFMAELIRLRADLNAVGNNFNQAVKKLNSMPESDGPNRWAIVYEQTKINVVKEVEEVNVNIRKFAEQWLQNSRQDHP